MCIVYPHAHCTIAHLYGDFFMHLHAPSFKRFFFPTVQNLFKFVRNIVKAGQDKIARIVPRLSASAAALCQIPNTIEY